MTAEQTVGDYRLLRVIGEGGMGVVHLALDRADRAVAVKVVRPHVAADPETRARLAREVRSLLRVRHPRVAEVLDADFDAELPYVVMRYVPGEPLDALVRRDGPLTGPALDELAVGLFEAVAAVHAVGVVHRDLKPGNVLMLDGSPVVIDFGIARALDDVTLTSTGLMVGTPGYLSPEVLDGTDVGTAADWWGWGAVVAFAATGRPPFRSGPLEAVWDRVRRGAVDLDGVPEPWARLLAATVRPDPSDRPTPEALADAVVRLTGRRPALPAAAGGGRDAHATTTAVQARPSGASAAAPDAGAPGAAAPDAAGRDAAARDAGAPGAAGGAAAPAAGLSTPSRPGTGPAPATPPTTIQPRPPAAGPAHVPAAQARGTAPLRVAAPARGTAPRPPAVPPYPMTSRGAADAAPPPAGTWPAPVARPSPGGPTGRGAVDGRGATVQPRLPGAGDGPVQRLPRRTGLELLGWLVVCAVAAVTPPGGAALLLLWAAVARSVQWSRVAAAMSRVRSGRLGAGARTSLTLMYPFRLVGALVISAAYLVVGLLLVSPLLLGAAVVLLPEVSWDSWTSVRIGLGRDAVLSVLVAVAALVAWFGPGGRAVRHGSRAVTEPVARHRNGRLVLAGLAGLVVVAAVLVVGARV